MMPVMLFCLFVFCESYNKSETGVFILKNRFKYGFQKAKTERQRQTPLQLA